MVDLTSLFSSLSTSVLDVCRKATTGARTTRARPRTLPDRQRQIRLSDDEVDQMVIDYKSGQPICQLVRMYAVHRTTVLEHLERRGVARRPNVRKLTDGDVNRAAHLYTNGASLVRVGEAFSVNESTIRREFSVAGVQIRPWWGQAYH